METPELTFSMDDATKTMLLLLAKCAEESFDKAKVVGEKEMAFLNAAQYVKHIVKQHERANGT